MPQQSSDLMSVDVRVSKSLREYVLAINGGSDTLVPAKHSLLWSLVKTQLDLVPADYRPVLPCDRGDYIRVALPRSRRTMSYNVNTQRTMEINTLFRCHLTDRGQKVVARHLLQSLKLVFRAYLGGALGNNPSLTIHDAIEEFCSDYGIEMEAITYDMLRKDWYRFGLRAGRGGVIPIENQNL